MSTNLNYTTANNNSYTLENYLRNSKYKVLKATRSDGKHVIIKALNFLINDPEIIKSLESLSQIQSCSNQTSTTLRKISSEESITLNYNLGLKRSKSDKLANCENLHREFDFLTKLNHSGIVRPVEKGDDFIIIDYHLGIPLKFKSASKSFKRKIVQEDSFETVTLESKNLPVNFDSLRFKRYISKFCSLLSIVDYMHNQGIIHRDLKPANVIDTNKEVILIDFDIAHKMGSDVEDEESVNGSLYFLSPEEVTKTGLDYRSDIYSLGVMLHISSSGSNIFQETMTNGERFQQKLDLEYLSPRLDNPDFPKKLDEILRRATAQKKEDRFNCADDFKIALKNYLISTF